MKEGKDYLTTHSAHFIYGYMASHMWKRTTAIARRKVAAATHGLLFSISCKVRFYMHHPKDSTYHELCYNRQRVHHEGPIRRPITLPTNALPWRYGIFYMHHPLRHDSIYHGLCYISCRALFETRNSSMVE